MARFALSRQDATITQAIFFSDDGTLLSKKSRSPQNYGYFRELE